MNASPPPSVHVVAAVILRDGRLLIARRAPEQKLAGQWEFPGGKVHAGESPQTALRRELQEELDVDARIGRRLGQVLHPDGARVLRLTFFAVTIPDRPILLRDHDETAWVTIDELDAYPLAAADRAFLPELRQALR